MSFTWSMFLELAETLERNPDEASKRSAISRAYYAIYNIACIYVPNNDHERKGGHRAYWSQWKHVDHQRHKLYIDATRLLDARKEADYELGSNDFNRAAQGAVTQARKLLKHIEVVLGRRS